MIFYGEQLLAPRPTPKLEGHPLSAVRDCLFSIFAASLQNWRASPPSSYRVKLNWIVAERTLYLSTYFARVKFVGQNLNTSSVTVFRFVGSGVQLDPLGTAATDWPIASCPGGLWWWRIWWKEDWQGKPKYSEKTRPSATLSNTNPIWLDPGSNPGRRVGKPATNSLSYGAA
jgi:hypothetical protein